MAQAGPARCVGQRLCGWSGRRGGSGRRSARGTTPRVDQLDARGRVTPGRPGDVSGRGAPARRPRIAVTLFLDERGDLPARDRSLAVDQTWVARVGTGPHAAGD